MKGLFIPPQLQDDARPKLKIRTMQRLRCATGAILLNFRFFFAKPMKKLTFENNIKQIESLTGQTVNTSYVTPENESAVFAKLAHFKNAKYIPINVYVNLPEDTKIAMEHVVASVNKIFKHTYMKMPKIIINFSPAKIAKLDPFSINFYEANSKYGVKGVTISNLYNTSKVADINSVDISLVSEVFSDAKKFKLIFLHEIMHAIFGFEDVYNPKMRKRTIMYGEYYDDNIPVLSLNDIFVANALCWQKCPSDIQKQYLLDFYKKYDGFVKGTVECNLER